MKITRKIAAKVLETVDAGLSNGIGIRKPGEMCVEAAVCYALGLPHGADPGCVSPALRNLKICLNDKQWSSNAARARGLRRLAIAQLGSAGELDDKEFAKKVSALAIQTCVSGALRAAASIHKDENHKTALCEAANRCEKEATRENALKAKTAAYAAYAANANAAAVYAADAADAASAANANAAAVYAAYAAKKSARDKILSDFAEGVVQILIEMKAPGYKWLDLAESA